MEEEKWMYVPPPSGAWADDLGLPFPAAGWSWTAGDGSARLTVADMRPAVGGLPWGRRLALARSLLSRVPVEGAAVLCPFPAAAAVGDASAAVECPGPGLKAPFRPI